MNPKLAEINEKIASGEAVAIDTRTAREFSRAHIPSSVSAPYNSWGWGKAVSDWLDGQNIPVILISNNSVVSEKALKELQAHKIEPLFVISDDLKEWMEEKLPVAQLIELDPEELEKEMDQWEIIDVREPYELNYGMIEGARNVPMSEVQNLVTSLDRSKKYAIVCAHGNRSEAAAMFLSDNGFHAATVVGGMANWINRSLPVVYPE
jgi:rhodanese-related sulfurtransferase